MLRVLLPGLLALNGCKADATQLLVLVDSDYEPAELDAVTVAVTPVGSLEETTHRFDMPATSLPVSFGVAPVEEDPTREVRIAVSAVREGEVLVTRQVITRFVEHETLLLPLFLSRVCVAVECPPGDVCDRGRCVPQRVDPGDLEPVEPNEPVDYVFDPPADAGLAKDATPAGDAGVPDADGGAPDDAGPDAGPDSGDSGIRAEHDAGDVGVDTGTQDGGDSGPVDAGPGDSGQPPDTGEPPDAGPPEPAAGTILFFDLPACPAGWATYTAADGRTVLALPSGGVREATVGVPLANPAGTRTIDQVGSHFHMVTIAGTTGAPGSHTHSITSRIGDDQTGGSDQIQETGEAADTTASLAASGAHTHSVSLPAFTSAETGLSEVDVTMPYLGLTVCEKQ